MVGAPGRQVTWASVYQRGDRWWYRIKDETGRWISKAAPSEVDDKRKAQRYATAAQKALDKRKEADAGTTGPHTVRSFSRVWLKERREGGVRSVDKEESRIRHHLLPRIGSKRLDEVRPRDIRDLVRALRAGGELAPRTIHNVYGDAHAMFRDAVVEELIESSPCVLPRGELPPKVDKDPEWRAAATYSLSEVERLISDPEIPVERRVMYAIKAIAGLRHGEAAGLRWRHYDPDLEPLGRLLVATSYDTGRTKTDVTRRVPVHPTLAKILAAWKLSHWERVYGRAPGADDLIVPARTMGPIAASDAGGCSRTTCGRWGCGRRPASSGTAAGMTCGRGSSRPARSTGHTAICSAWSRTRPRATSSAATRARHGRRFAPRSPSSRSASSTGSCWSLLHQGKRTGTAGLKWWAL
jgi:integrase